jgi:hypothetical protein
MIERSASETFLRASSALQPWRRDPIEKCPPAGMMPSDWSSLTTGPITSQQLCPRWPFQ